MQDARSIEIYLPFIKTPLILDIEDYHKFKERNWYYCKHTNRLKHSYNIRKGLKYTTKTLQFHRVLVKDLGPLIDHVNRNSMDNRKSNLRKASISLNTRNSVNKGGTSKYRGVHWSLARKKWIATIRQNDGIYKNLGGFCSEIDAAKAYNEASIKNFGTLGFINALC